MPPILLQIGKSSLYCLANSQTLIFKTSPNPQPTIANQFNLTMPLKRLQLTDVGGISCKAGKVERLVAQSPKLGAGQMRLPESAPWLAAFRSEVAAFPNGKHDDQVDSMSQMLNSLDLRPYEIGKISRYK